MSDVKKDATLGRFGCWRGAKEQFFWQLTRRAIGWNSGGVLSTRSIGVPAIEARPLEN